MTETVGQISAFSVRLGRIIEEEWGDNVAQFARAAGISDSLVRKYLKEKSQPGLDKILMLAEAAGVTVGWLAAGEEPKRKGEASEPQVVYQTGQEGLVSLEDMTIVPVYGAQLSAGHGAENDSAQIIGRSAFMTSWLHNVARISPSKAFVAEVRGESMLDLLEDGDLVLGEMTKEIDRQGIYVVRHWEAVHVKHVAVNGDWVRLISENDIYPPIEMESPGDDEFGVIGRVVRRIVRMTRR